MDQLRTMLQLWSMVNLRMVRSGPNMGWSSSGPVLNQTMATLVIACCIEVSNIFYSQYFHRMWLHVHCTCSNWPTQLQLQLQFFLSFMTTQKHFCNCLHQCRGARWVSSIGKTKWWLCRLAVCSQNDQTQMNSTMGCSELKQCRFR